MTWSDWLADRERVAAEDGQATVLVALGAWLALLAALALVTACAYGAAWATDIWTLRFIAGGR